MSTHASNPEQLNASNSLTFTPSLATALRSNAAFSITSALIMMGASAWLAEVMGNLPALVYQIMGAGLLLFALDVLYVSEKVQTTGAAKLITLLDLSWVLGSMVLLTPLFDWFSVAGKTIIFIIAAIVGVLALWQWRSIQQSENTR